MLTISVVNLKGALSNLMPPGAMSNMKPKSGGADHCVSGARIPSIQSPITNMKNVTFTVEHDVPIVPILDLEEIQDHGIRCETLYKSAPRLSAAMKTNLLAS